MAAQSTCGPIPLMVLVRPSRPSPSRSRRRAKIKRVIVSGVIGFTVGFVAAVLAGTAAPTLDNSALPTTSGSLHNVTNAANGGTSKFTISDLSARELERLKTRNRRLEALVAVLRAREEQQQTTLR
jgi:tetrahydromethanopterin S-methyltransferase subunit F